MTTTETQGTETNKPIFYDGTNLTKITGPAVRVELRQVRDPPGKKSPFYQNKIVDKNFIVGLVECAGLPQEGTRFRMAYHNLNGALEFGEVDSGQPLENVEKHQDGRVFYFCTKKGSFRLTVLDAGN